MSLRPRPALSPREKQLLDLAARGMTDSAISHELDISEATISTYWGRIRVKLGPFSRTELVAIVMKEENDLALQELRKENEKLAERLRLKTGEYPDGNFYKDLLEAAADAIFLTNQDGIIENLSDAAAELFGYSKDQLKGKPITMLIPERYRMIHGQHRQAYLEEPTKRKMGEHSSTFALHSSGREFSIAATLSALKVETGYNIVCIVREVSVR
jgi:PAS domain S-box-containing protein